MQTTEGEKYRFFHNGDFSGDVIIADKATGEQTDVPFDDLKTLVVAYVRAERISQLEQRDGDQAAEEIAHLENAGDDEILGLSPC